jgi:hypothetical protein
VLGGSREAVMSRHDHILESSITFWLLREESRRRAAIAAQGAARPATDTMPMADGRAPRSSRHALYTFPTPRIGRFWR